MSDRTQVDLSGVFVPNATPFDPVTGDADVVAARANVRAWLEHGVRGIVVGGSTGEAVLLEDHERARLIEMTRDLLTDDHVLIAGTGAESTRRTIDLTRRAAEGGADAVLVQPPAFYTAAMTAAALKDHYGAVADASPVPVILYQVPLRFATLEFNTGLVAELSGHPNIVGIKDSRGKLDLVGELVTSTASDFQVLVGSGALLYASLEVGAVGGILGVANLGAGACALLFKAFRAGDHAEAGRIQDRIGPAHRDIVGAYGVPGVKAGLDLLGLNGGAPRPPLRPLPERDVEVVRKVLVTAGLLGN